MGVAGRRIFDGARNLSLVTEREARAYFRRPVSYYWNEMFLTAASSLFSACARGRYMSSVLALVEGVGGVFRYKVDMLRTS